MKKVAVIFPGQGSQSVGMGQELYEYSPAAKAVFDKADSIIKGLKDIIFDGPQEKLTSTCYCQPAIMTVSIAAYEALKASNKFKGLSLGFACGHSLGECSALVACGALSFEDGLKLVSKRAEFMEEACKINPGKMAAIIGFDEAKLVEICEKTGVQVANYNSDSQIVITGEADKVLEAAQLISAQGAKRLVVLEVAGGFHSTLMQPAADKFKEFLKGIEFNKLDFPIISNVDALPTTDIEKIRENLSKQIVSSVQWVKTVRYVSSQNIKDFIEFGPGNVLKGLIRGIDRELSVSNIRVADDVDKIEV
ncbi:MAG: [acyl-carrier-protein] S-malonyltransferase [Omnitrophica WOR_2 bacterium GWF2_38_59]|nr:MAG: [acyl-carrier-protein] S-malonyltransferase [Omnitrophica WOR_2 bacterium GWF2_38_59]OGX51059.1 MAG: [acyl-carrier-protein] S-malonyltransferase [Omnitrophica WOR_2 bacterium RIFOXYA12_FULL_38_10]HBG60565.1 [acyl-carrier-protein] S-malonyltransferase [Candidatus Omnitrophota bacterium]